MKNTMANTYTQIHIHAVFAVQNRRCLILPAWEKDLHKYITGIVQTKGHKMLQINGMPDHVHLLFGMRPTQSISDLMKSVKQSSSSWINDNKLIKGRFSWQAGYGAFSYSKPQIKTVIKYIKNQKIHHRKTTFREEYIELLQEFNLEYDDKFIFKVID